MGDRYDVAIVGAGIAGASLAWHLAPTRRVLLLEAESQPGYHSTGRSAAMFMESYGAPQVRALTRASRSFLAAPPAGFADTPILSPRGALYVAWHGQERELDTTAATLRATGTTIERLDAAQTLERVPVLRREGLVGALFEADAMDIDVHALHQGFLRGARRAGAVLRNDARLVAAGRRRGTWRLRCADGSEAEGAVLVDAAGAWADAVAQLCNVAPLGLEPRRRSAFTFEAPSAIEPRDWPVTAGIDETWYFKPDAGVLLGSPANADPVLPHDVVPEELDIAEGIARIEAATTMTIRRPRRTWAGLRTFSPDGELVIGWDRRADGFFWLAGQGGYGIQSCVGAAWLASGLIRGEAPAEPLRGAGVEPARLAPRPG